MGRQSPANQKENKVVDASQIDTAAASKESSAAAKTGIALIREWYFASLFVCFAGVMGCYSGYAFLQESLLADKDKKLNVNLVMGLQSTIAVLISSTIIKVFGMGDLFGSFTSGDLIVGALNFFTMFFSNFALKFVNYPFMVLAKSAKILPVLFTGWIFGVYKLTWAQVGIAITISSGLVVFNSNKVKGGYADDSVTGILLVMMSLLFDGFVNMQTDKNHRQQKRQFAYHSMLYTNSVGLIGNFLFFQFAQHVYEDDTLERVLSNPTMLRDVILIGMTGACGQIFIFLTISLHDCYMLSIITTSRKCFSVVASAFIFNHAFTNMQWVGASMVLASTCLEVYLGNKKKRAEAEARKQKELNKSE